MPHRRLTIILGAPRSGTTWLGKVFDSHSRVFYRHEPDLVGGRERLPEICSDALTRQDILIVHRFVKRLMDERNLKASCSLPVFRKHHDSGFSHFLRTAAILMLKTAGQIIPRHQHKNLALPYFLDQPRDHKSHIVMKSVTSLGRANLLLHALPKARLIFIIRNALGQVASQLQGIRLGKMPHHNTNPAILTLPAAVRFGLTPDHFRTLPLAEQLAWEWALMNEKAHTDIAASPRVRIIRHTDLVTHPIARTQELMQFAGLAWEEGVATFIQQSTQFKGRENYFQVMRDSRAITGKWRHALTPDERRQIQSVMRITAACRQWPEVLKSPL